MIKLTDEWVIALFNRAETTVTGHRAQALYVARAIEAEVLCLNGWQPIEKAPMDGAEVLVGEQGSGDYELARYHAGMGWLDRCSDDLHFTPTHFLDPMPPEAPRATGCPETMDDTGRFAEVDMPAFLRKQNPA